MDFPKVGDTIKVNFDVEVEAEDGSILRLEAGEEMTVTGYDDRNSTSQSSRLSNSWLNSLT
jgi:hypothetical protein